MAQCENKKVEILYSLDKNRQFRIRADCLELVDMRDSVTQTAAYPKDFETPRPPVRAAVSIALASLRMPKEVELMVPWINHHGY